MNLGTAMRKETRRIHKPLRVGCVVEMLADEGVVVVQPEVRAARWAGFGGCTVQDSLQPDPYGSFEAPVHAVDVRVQLEKSLRWIRDLADDYDGGGARAVPESTFGAAVEFVVRYVRWVAQDRHAAVPIPDVSPCPDGSLDVHWRGTSLELLVNFKADAGQPATYYGDTYSDELVVKGKLPPDLRVETLIAFLAGVA